MDKIFKNIKYIELMPKTQAEKYPLIINVHGAGGRGTSLDGIRGSVVEQYAQSHDDFPAVVICPLCFANTWFDIFEQLKEFIEYASTLPYIDTDRVYLTGTSMGGYASWQLLMSFPEKFAAAIVCCGGGMYWNSGRIKIPVWAFHGEDDPVVLCVESKNMVKAINDAGGQAKLTILPKVQHNCWDYAYSQKQTYDFLFANAKK